MKLSFTDSREHTFYFVGLAQGTPSFGLWAPKLTGHGVLPRLTPPLSGTDCGSQLLVEETYRKSLTTLIT